MKTGKQPKSELKKVDITQTVDLQNRFFFGADTTFCTYFIVLVSVTI